MFAQKALASFVFENRYASFIIFYNSARKKIHIFKKKRTFYLKKSAKFIILYLYARVKGELYISITRLSVFSEIAAVC